MPPYARKNRYTYTKPSPLVNQPQVKKPLSSVVAGMTHGEKQKHVIVNGQLVSVKEFIEKQKSSKK